MTEYKKYINEIEKRKALNLNPKPIDTANLIKEIILQIKDENHPEREKSLDVVDKALKINEEDEALINQYITIAFSAFQWDEVIKGVERAKSKNINKDGKYDLMLGIAYFELDDVKNAEAAFNNAKISKKYKDQGAAWLEYIEALKG